MTKRSFKLRKVIAITICLAGTTMFSSIAMAQNDSVPAKEKEKGKFGNFVRRVGESTTGINMSNEIFAVLPAKAKPYIELVVVSCVDDSRTGDVLLVFAVKAKQNGIKTNLGKSCGNGNQQCVTGYDTKGKTFSGVEVGSFTETFTPKETPAGVPIQFEFTFTSVPSTLKAIEVVMVDFEVSGNGVNVHTGMGDVEPIQVRNIPILWDVAK